MSLMRRKSVSGCGAVRYDCRKTRDIARHLRQCDVADVPSLHEIGDSANRILDRHCGIERAGPIPRRRRDAANGMSPVVGLTPEKVRENVMMNVDGEGHVSPPWSDG